MDILLSWTGLKLAILPFLLLACIGWRLIVSKDTVSPLGAALMYAGLLLTALWAGIFLIRGLWL